MPFVLRSFLPVPSYTYVTLPATAVTLCGRFRACPASSGIVVRDGRDVVLRMRGCRTGVLACLQVAVHIVRVVRRTRKLVVPVRGGRRIHHPRQPVARIRIHQVIDHRAARPRTLKRTDVTALIVADCLTPLAPGHRTSRQAAGTVVRVVVRVRHQGRRSSQVVPSERLRADVPVVLRRRAPVVAQHLTEQRGVTLLQPPPARCNCT